MDEPLVSQPQTGKWLGRTHVALISEARPGSLRESFHIRHTACIHLGHCCGSCECSCKTVLLQWPSHTEMSQPLEARDTAWPQRLLPSQSVSCLKGLAVAGNRVFGHSSNRRAFLEAWGPPTRYLVPLSHPKPTLNTHASYAVAM